MKCPPLLTLAIGILSTATLQAQVKSVSADTDWSSQQVVLKNTAEAEFIIRIGDVDNLGFGWPEAFDPFCSRMTQAHQYPWDIKPDDLPGFDRILLSSRFDPAKPLTCGGDGYSGSFDKEKCRPVTWTIPTDALSNTTIQNAFLQLFIDDFQAPTFCSKFQLLINNKRFVEGEKILNAIDQTGPVGKLVTIPLTEDLYPLLSGSKNISLLIDESTGSGDGFALDFVRLLVNRQRENSCKGTVRGKVMIKDTDRPIAGARVFLADHHSVLTDTNGAWELKDIPTGFEVLGASASGYVDGSATADIGQGDENPEVTIYLAQGKTARYNNRPINVGESITLNAVLFVLGKAEMKPESKPELEKLLAFLQANPTAEIELSGHTSAEGERRINISLSYKRVKACKDYLVAGGIAEDRIIAIGFGPDQPVAPNDTEANRAKNRRVEMRLKRL